MDRQFDIDCRGLQKKKAEKTAFRYGSQSLKILFQKLVQGTFQKGATQTFCNDDAVAINEKI